MDSIQRNKRQEMKSFLARMIERRSRYDGLATPVSTAVDIRSPARDIVFSTTELVEAILLQLDMKTLLVSAMRVNKMWCGTINNSPSLQQALYFKPMAPRSPNPSGSYSHIDCQDSSSGSHEPWPTLNPLLVYTFGPCFFDLYGKLAYLRRAKSFYLMPWTDRARQALAKGEKTHEYSTSYPVKMDAETAREEQVARRPFTRRGASWRRMLVSQPPPHRLGHMEVNPENIWVELENVPTAVIDASVIGEGLRMGQLYDMIQYWAGHHKEHSLWFRVHWHQFLEPSTTKLSREIAESMLSEHGVVVEFQRKEDMVWGDHLRDPQDVDLFDDTFRCDEYSHVEIQLHDNKRPLYEFPDFDWEVYLWLQSPTPESIRAEAWKRAVVALRNRELHPES
jgi:hypothetical protein